MGLATSLKRVLLTSSYLVKDLAAGRDSNGYGVGWNGIQATTVSSSSHTQL